MLTKIYLEGALARNFGKEWELDINSAVEAIQLINANRPDFKKWVRDNLKTYDMLQFICEYHDGHFEEVTEETFFYQRHVKSIRIIPAVYGAGRAFKIIAGIALIIIGAVCSCYSGGTSSGLSKLGLTMLAGACTALGSSLLMAGLMGKQKSNDNDDGSSYYFNGAVNTTSQGGAVPLVFGRCKVGSAVISSTINVSDK